MKHAIRVSFIWVCGLIFAFALTILWLCLLGLAIFELPKAYGWGAVISYAAVVFVVLMFLGAGFVRFVNGFYNWWLTQRVNSLADNYQSEVSMEFSETFIHQLRSSPTFQATVKEAKTLAEELAAFSASSHTDEERDTFRKFWQARADKFAKHVAEGDPLAVEVILKAIEKESGRSA